MNKKIIFGFLVFILLIGTASATVSDLVFSLGRNYGLSVVSAQNPLIATALNFALNPEGTILSEVANRVDTVIPGFSETINTAINPKGAALNKIIGEVAKTNPELATEITKSITYSNYLKIALEPDAEVKIKNGEIVEGSGHTQGGDATQLFYNVDKEEKALVTITQGWFYEKFGDETLLMVDENAENAFLKFGDNVYANLKKGSALKFVKDEEGNLILSEADITTSRGGSSYVFTDKIHELTNVPADTRIIFKDGIVTVYGKDNAFNYLGNNIKINEENVNLQFNKVTCSSCYVGEIKLSRGELEIKNNGYLAKSGLFKYKELEFVIPPTTSSRDELFVTDKDISYDGNYLIARDKSIEINSKEGRVGVRALGNNKVLNTDDKDNLVFIVTNGDNLKITNRNEQGLIPNINYKDSDNGKTIIFNNDLIFNVDKNDIKVNLNRVDRNEEYYNKPYQSVAFELEKDFSKLRVNAYSQYIVLDKTNQEAVTYNKFELPISNRLQDNECQDQDCLQKKYPQIRFSIPEDLGIFGHNDLYDINEVHPFMVYYTDEWLKQHPDALNKIEEIGFSDINNAYYQGSTAYIVLGEKRIDPIYEVKTRDAKPLDIFTHEYEHLQDGLKLIQELEYSKEINPEFKDEFEEFTFLNEKLNKNLARINELKDTKSTLNTLEDKDTLKQIDDKISELRKRNDELYAKKDKKISEILTIGQSDPNYKRLNVIYNEHAKSLINNLLDNKDKLRYVISPFNELTLGYLKEEYKEFPIAFDRVKKYAKEFYDVDIEYELMHGDELEKPVYIYLTIGEIINLKEEGGEEVHFESDLNLLSNIAENVNLLGAVTKSEEHREYVLRTYPQRIGESLQILQAYYDELKFANLGGVMERIGEESGIPSLYALKQYGPIESLLEEGITRASFSELSATYREESIEVRKQRVKSSNILMSESYKFLTQATFDSGKMDVTEYQDVMDIKCKTLDCIELKCVEYKLVCCRDNPNSPHCKS